MLWYNLLQNTIYCGILECTTYRRYQGANRRNVNISHGGGPAWSEPLSPWI